MEHHARGVSNAVFPALFSGLILVSAVGWHLYSSYNIHTPQITQTAAARSGATRIGDASSSTFSVATTAGPEVAGNLTDLGNSIVQSIADSYKVLTDKGTPSSDDLQQAGSDLAKTINATIQTRVFTVDDVQSTADISNKRAMQYRADLQKSLAPLLKLGGPEFEAFAQYTQSKDPQFLTELTDDAAKYRAAVQATQSVVTPYDARDEQAGILNAMQSFAATLEALASHANDPFASGALLKNYNQGESDIVSSFQSLATYFRSKAS